MDIEFTNETADTEDYTPNIDIVIFEPGQTAKTISVPTRNDSAREEDETFKIGVAEVKRGNVADYSDIAIGTIIDEDAPLSVYPNPARANSTIQLEGIQNGPYQFGIFSMAGELIQKETITVEGTYELLLNNMSRGFYVIRVAGIERSYSGKVIIQ